MSRKTAEEQPCRSLAQTIVWNEPTYPLACPGGIAYLLYHRASAAGWLAADARITHYTHTGEAWCLLYIADGINYVH